MSHQIQPFTNTQLEISKTFRHDLSEEDLKRFRQHLSEFLRIFLWMKQTEYGMKKVGMMQKQRNCSIPNSVVENHSHEKTDCP